MNTTVLYDTSNRIASNHFLAFKDLDESKNGVLSNESKTKTTATKFDNAPTTMNVVNW